VLCKKKTIEATLEEDGGVARPFLIWKETVFHALKGSSTGLSGWGIFGEGYLMCALGRRER